MDKNAYHDYLRSLVSEETSSNESTPPISPIPIRQERKRKNNSKVAENAEKRRRDEEEEEDPQEGTSRGPANKTAYKPNFIPPEKLSKKLEKGMVAFSDKNVGITVKSVSNQRNTRFRADDHLYQINIVPHRRTAPLLLSLEKALHEALTTILMQLKTLYVENLHHQIYLTIIEQNILHGLNTGNYDINAPANIITNRAMTILHSYLKSKQTLRLNNSFKIQIKVLSHRHTQHLVTHKQKFKKHVYRKFARESRYRN